MDELAVKYEANGQEITLTKDDVKKYLVSGDASKVTDKELKMFLELCKAQGLNPFLREAYLIIRERIEHRDGKRRIYEKG